MVVGSGLVTGVVSCFAASVAGTGSAGRFKLGSKFERNAHLTALGSERTGRGRGSSLSLGGLGSRGSGLGGSFGGLVGLFALSLEGSLELGLEVVKGVKS